MNLIGPGGYTNSIPIVLNTSNQNSLRRYLMANWHTRVPSSIVQWTTGWILQQTMKMSRRCNMLEKHSATQIICMMLGRKDLKHFLSVNEISTAVASVNEKATEKQSVGTTKGNHIFQTPISRSHDTKMVLEVNSRKRSIQQHQHAFKNSNFSWTVFQLNPIIWNTSACTPSIALVQILYTGRTTIWNIPYVTQCTIGSTSASLKTTTIQPL